MNLTTLLQATPALSNLTSYLSNDLTLLATLGNATNITILAPSDAAFAKYNNGLAPERIDALLRYHVLNGSYLADLAADPSANPSVFPHTLLQSSNGTFDQVVEVGLVKGQAVLHSGIRSNATVTTANLNFTGGVLHIIDSVLNLPQNVSTTLAEADLTGTEGALARANVLDMLDGLRNVTVFVGCDSFRRMY